MRNTIPHMLLLVNDPDHGLQRAVVNAISMFSQYGESPFIVEFVILRAQPFSKGELCPMLTKAIPNLIDVLKSGEPCIRFAAKSALISIFQHCEQLQFLRSTLYSFLHSIDV